MAVVGNIGDTGPKPFFHAVSAYILSLVFHLSAVYPADSCYYLGQFLLSVAFHACDSQDFSPADCKAYVVQGHLGAVLFVEAHILKA